MADNVNLTAGDGTIVAGTDTIGGVAYPRAKLVWGPDGTVNDADVASGKPLPIQLRSSTGTAITPISPDVGSGTGGSATQRVIMDSSQAGALGQNTMANSQAVVNASDQCAMITCSTDITRPADTNAYVANDVWSDSTSAPTAGGFTLSNAGGLSGGSGVITDIYIASSAVPGTLLQGELHIFDSAVTAVNDNAAWNLSDGDAKLRLAIVAFTLLADANNSYYHAQNLNIGYTCVGSANLRYLVKVKNAYTPISAEVLTVRAKCMRSN